MNSLPTQQWLASSSVLSSLVADAHPYAYLVVLGIIWFPALLVDEWNDCTGFVIVYQVILTSLYFIGTAAGLVTGLFFPEWTVGDILVPSSMILLILLTRAEGWLFPLSVVLFGYFLQRALPVSKEKITEE
jgi:hypothetical protein